MDNNYALYCLMVDRRRLDKELLEKIEEFEEKVYGDLDTVIDILNGHKHNEDYEEVILMAKKKHRINLYAIYNDPDESNAEYTGLIWCMELKLPKEAKNVGATMMAWCVYS